jgi:hypothetical protein
MMPCLRFWYFSAAVLAITVSGCGSDRPPLGIVAGEVTFEGKPISEGAIIFEVAGSRSASGKIVDGKITEVTTYDSGDGVPVGLARIAVHASAVKTAEANAELAHPGDLPSNDLDSYMGVAKSLIPDRYNDPSSSGLTFQIERGTNSVTIDLQPQ